MDKNIDRQIARNKARWQAATKVERRVMVARDVLKRIGSGQIKVKNRVWAVFPAKIHNLGTNSLQECILHNVSCECCALGGLMVSQISFDNKKDISAMRGGDFGERVSLFYGDLNETYNGQNEGVRLDALWGKRNNQLMEIAFELGRGNTWLSDSVLYVDKSNEHNLKSGRKEELAAYRFGKKYRTAKDRMIAIMKNVIKNKGVFIP